ncbi:SDR family oxidoreductase [Nocardioides immobilis]|uniref:SDR family oxidoreductase n=1 Tax=Nocardioides immobilis TaxID=2049295 RepID=A0A417Y0Y1_9ACTN|nr:SDR family oxidoreductase [Nocardioides immobilis]RHW26308.1 SDR family oxidoreductase [Nocardioides immobilis]
MQELFSVKGKKAVVTGGTRGIGYMIAEGLLKAGAEVYISSRKADSCEEAARDLGKLGTVHAFARDLSQESECRLLVEQIAEHTDTVDILVNDAGVTWGAPLEDYPDSGWDRVMDLNVKGVFNMTRFLRPMLDKAAMPDHPARVINISSIDATMVPLFPAFAYGASKAAVNQLTVHLAAELAPNILVNAIAPGPFPTKMMNAILDEQGDEIRAMTRVGRTGEPDDIAGAVIFLASRAANYVTGAVLPVDGGLSTTGAAN